MIIDHVPTSEPAPLVVTDEMRLAVLAEMWGYAAPSTRLAFAKSLAAKPDPYPLDLTRYTTI